MPLSPDEVRAIMDRHRWRPGERETVLADVAEQKAEREADGDPWPRADVIRKERPIEVAKPEAAKPMTQPTDDWVRYINQQVRKSERLMSECVGKVLGQVDKRHADALDEVRQELAALKRELVELRAEAKVRGALDEMQARMDKIEAGGARTPLHTVGTALRA